MDEHTNTHAQRDWDFRAIFPKSPKPFARRSGKIRVCGHYRGLSKKEVFDWTLSKAARNSQSSKFADFTPGAKKLRPPSGGLNHIRTAVRSSKLHRSIAVQLPAHTEIRIQLQNSEFGTFGTMI